jgi:nitroreductase/catechol 2,3-dioxygenase-like lactoylglutathione lyase family enzyme
MNETLKTIHNWQTTHGNFTARTVGEPDLQTILDAAVRAPNSSNRQPYSIVVLDDRATMKAVCGYEASHALVFVVDFNRLVDVAAHLGHPFTVNGLPDFLTACVDTTLAAQNAALAARSLGVDALFTNGIFRVPLATVSEKLGLPAANCFPLLVLALGYADKPASRRKGRYAGPGLIHRGRYQCVTTTEMPALLTKYDDDLGLSDEWRAAGMKHYLDFYYTKWARVVPLAKLVEFETALRTEGFLRHLTTTFRLNHVCLTVADLERASRFYEQVLGGQRLKDVTDAQGQAFVRFLRLGEGVVELFRRNDAPAARTGHLAVQVDDAVAACAAIRAAGYDVGQPLHRPSGNVIVIVKDPDGHEIEIIQHAAGMDPQSWPPNLP